MQDNPYYLGEKDEEPDIDDIPIVRLDDSELGASSKFLSITMCPSVVVERRR